MGDRPVEKTVGPAVHTIVTLDAEGNEIERYPLDPGGWRVLAGHLVEVFVFEGGGEVTLRMRQVQRMPEDQSTS